MNIQKILKENQKRLNAFFFKHKDLLALKKDLLGTFGIPDIKTNGLIIATGHQPVFHYPGLLFKNYYAAKIASECKGSVINFIVDSDIADIAFPVPCRKGADFNKQNVALANEMNKLYAFFLPGENEIRSFFDKIEQCLSSLNSRGIFRSFDQYRKEFLLELKNSNSFTDTILLLQKRFESFYTASSIDLKISNICRERTFYHFVWVILKDHEDFIKVYNYAVKDHSTGSYREIKQLPFKNNRFELPFWFIREGTRFGVSLEKRGSTFIFYTDDKVIFKLEADKRSQEEIINSLHKNILLYPKAIMLTLMIRLFFSDIFVHGTGGAVYDKITDAIMKEYFKLHPTPGFLTVSGNIYLPLTGYISGDINEKLKKLQRYLDDMTHHPVRYMDKKEARKYINKKKMISAELLKEKGVKERATLHTQLKNLTHEMIRSIQPGIDKTGKELNKIKAIMDYKGILLERMYPRFFYPSAVNFKVLLEKEIRVSYKNN
ncbi:MAG: hypothetical protein KKH98_03220 [Spirochaetes bacterium]|nr:hypothetical protein [Spirochaetota bacterium]